MMGDITFTDLEVLDMNEVSCEMEDKRLTVQCKQS